jgi:hypothetical protein
MDFCSVTLRSIQRHRLTWSVGCMMWIPAEWRAGERAASVALSAHHVFKTARRVLCPDASRCQAGLPVAARGNAGRHMRACRPDCFPRRDDSTLLRAESNSVLPVDCR